MKISKPEYWKILFNLWTIQGVAAFLWLVSIPTDTENPFAFGFSTARLALIGVAILLIVLSAALWWQSRASSFRQTWLNLDMHPTLWDLIYLAALLAVIVAVGFLAAIPLFKNNLLYPVYVARLSPLILWVSLSSLELAIWLAWQRYEKTKSIFAALQPVWRRALWLLLIFSLLGSLVALTKIGITPDDNWSAPPIPFLEWQIWFVAVFIGIFGFFPNLLSKRNQNWLPWGIYIFTVVLWLSQPINTAFTATPPRAPNYEIYPFSDAQFYAQYAQSALTGNGFLWPEIPSRPFYAAFLTWLHLLGSQKYQNVIVLQTLVLATFPVVLYLLGKEIGGKPLGMGLALLAAFRDINANIAVPFASNVTYSKLFLSELPTALLISLATLLSIHWLRSSPRPAWRPLLIGGLLAAASLIRLQSSILIAPLAAFAFLIIPDRKQWLQGTLLVMLGSVIVLTPWLTRNYLAAGGLILDNPISQTMTMARRWSGSAGNELLPRLQGENDAQYSSRLTKMALTSFREHPGVILHSAANHFINNEIASLLAFPVRDEIITPSELFKPQHVFWGTPLNAGQVPLLAFYLWLFALGTASAWYSHKWIGLLPLGLGLMYNLWTALFLSSGARFVVPLDWSIHLYEVFGLAILGSWILSFAQGARENVLAWVQAALHPHDIVGEQARSSRPAFLVSLFGVLILGAFLPFTESIFPQRYPPKSQTELIQQIGMIPMSGEVVLYGRALYPRYYAAGDGEPATAKLGYGRAKEARLVFFLVGPRNGLVIFELENAPEFFPNTADVYMIGTQLESHFSPRVVMVSKDSKTELYISK